MKNYLLNRVFFRLRRGVRREPSLPSLLALLLLLLLPRFLPLAFSGPVFSFFGLGPVL